MCVAHYIPFRAIRAGKQLSDSKGSSAAISTEAAVLAMQRSMDGFLGPRDIFRNPEAIFRFFEDEYKPRSAWPTAPPTNGDSPFNLILAKSGSDFAVCGMHFKLGLYEHQSAGALQGVVNAVLGNPDLVAGGVDGIKGIAIKCYEPAFGIIGDP